MDQLELPLSTPDPATLSAGLRKRLAQETIPPALARALSRKQPGPIRDELEAILRELFAGSSRHRTGIKLIDRCARDLPELTSIFYRKGRFAQLEALSDYLASRIERGSLRAVPDVAVAARFVIEAVATWAVHIHWDPAPQPIDARDAEETLVQIVVAGLTGSAAA